MYVLKIILVNYIIVYHLSLSLSVGGLKPLFDIKNNALIGCRSNMGGCSSANSIAVIPHAQISHS